MKSGDGRAALEGAAMYLGSVGIVVGTLVFGLLLKSFLWGGIFFVCACIALAYFLKAANKMGRVSMRTWLDSIPNKDFSYAWDGTGIAIDIQNNKIFLSGYFSGKQESKSYDLTEVREWGYEIHKPDVVFLDNKLSNPATNHAHEVSAREKNGFWVSMADVQFPVWFIKFEEKKDLETELARWMEIMQQMVNKN